MPLDSPSPTWTAFLDFMEKKNKSSGTRFPNFGWYPREASHSQRECFGKAGLGGEWAGGLHLECVLVRLL